MKNSIVKKTKEILTNLDIVKAPVPVEHIALQYGIKISYAPSNDYSGVLIRKSDGGILMGINSNERYSRIRFTIAHELAHFIFDKEQAIAVDYRNITPLTVKPEKEKRADCFAANLLMPQDLLITDFKEIVKNARYLTENNLRKLSELYQVSKEAMKYRLKNIGLIPQENNEMPF